VRVNIITIVVRDDVNAEKRGHTYYLRPEVGVLDVVGAGEETSQEGEQLIKSIELLKPIDHEPVYTGISKVPFSPHSGGA
jgi:hypothetical protein